MCLLLFFFFLLTKFAKRPGNQSTDRLMLQRKKFIGRKSFVVTDSLKPDHATTVIHVICMGDEGINKVQKNAGMRRPRVRSIEEISSHIGEGFMSARNVTTAVIGNCDHQNTFEEGEILSKAVTPSSRAWKWSGSKTDVGGPGVRGRQEAGMSHLPK
jgi:hypothetical protein